MSININPIETYVPTIYVNNSEPDLDETNLNHAEQALKRVTDAANAAILALESLDSAKIDAAKIVNNLLATDTSTVLSGPMGKALGDRLTAAENLLTKLNGDLYKWLNVTRLDTGNDVNDLSSPSLAYSYSTASHAPFDGISANILTIGIDGYKAQIAFGVSRDSVQVKVRTSYDFVWQGWRSVTLS